MDKLLEINQNNFYIEINENDFDKFYSIYLEFSDIIENDNLTEELFTNFLKNFSEKNNFSNDEIKAVDYKNNKVIIYLNNGKNYDFSLSEIALGNLDLEKTEEKAKILELAMESIFLDNTGIFDELNLDDKFDFKKLNRQLKYGKIKLPNGKKYSEVLELLKPYEGKNLKELKSEIESVESKLKNYYKIIGDTKKEISILEREISHYAGIGDKYEGGARLFGIKSEDLAEKISEIVNKKTVPELLEYIMFLNIELDNNGKIDDMAKSYNVSVISQLSEKTFEKIKKEKSPNREVINFVQVITGRKITEEKNGKISKKNLKVSLHGDFKQTEVANKALVYLLYDRGIINKVSEKQKINLQTEIFKGKENNSVSSILDESMQEFKNLGFGEEQIQTILKETGIKNLNKNEKISNLSFDETLFLGSIYAISKDIRENINLLKGKSPDEIFYFIQEKNIESTKEIFEELNESLDNNFGATLFDWNGKNGADFGLSGEEAEIFDLYGELNGRGLFRLAENNFFKETFLNSQTGVVMAVGVVTAMIVLSPAVMAAGGVSLLIAGAKIGVTTTIASQLMDNKGYANVKEAAAGVAIQGAIDIGFSSLFTAGSGILIGWAGPKIYGSFGKTLTKEVAGKNISRATQNRLGNILKEADDVISSRFNIFRGPQKHWKPQLEKAMNEVKVFKQVGFSGQLSEETIKYLGKYQAVNGLKGNIIDAGIGLSDGISSSILWQTVGHPLLKKLFYENHYNPDSGETFESVRKKIIEEIKEQSTIVRNNLENQSLANPELNSVYKELTEDDKQDLSLLFVYLLNN